MQTRLFDTMNGDFYGIHSIKAASGGLTFAKAVAFVNGYFFETT